MFECGGIRIVVIGQVFFYMLIVNFGWMFFEYVFGICDENMQVMVDEVCVEGVECVVVLSYNGFDVDKKMVIVVSGIDVILFGYIYDVLFEFVLLGKMIIVFFGLNGKFVSWVDFDVCNGQLMGYCYKLILIFFDVIELDVEMVMFIEE